MRTQRIIYSMIITGMIFFSGCKKDAPVPEGQTREYYIQADEVEWDYAPSSSNLFSGMPYTMDEMVYLVNDTNRIGKKNIKAVYHRYTDGSFTTRMSTSDDGELGILGPVIRAAVGDKIKVVFRNNTTIKASMHPHGVRYDSSNEGITGIEPGQTFTYQWEVPESAGPASADGSSCCWFYHSHVMEYMGADVYAGLAGPLVIYRKGFLENDKAIDVDAEKFAMFSVMNENASLYLDTNIVRYTTGMIDKEDPDFQESNLKHSINGLMYGNLQYHVSRGQLVRWYIFAVGNEVDWHTAHWHGNTVEFRHNRTDVIAIGPAGMAVADMVAENPGAWQFHCHVDDHMMAGMDAIYHVD